jgi:hypothetical protein
VGRPGQRNSVQLCAQSLADPHDLRPGHVHRVGRTAAARRGPRPEGTAITSCPTSGRHTPASGGRRGVDPDKTRVSKWRSYRMTWTPQGSQL